jgi:energy-coupling factor transport system ATP-binding protein
MNEYIIETENVGFTYTDNEETDIRTGSEIPALSGVNIKIKRGEYVAVLGHNGSGKSTFAKLLNLILTPTVGKIFIDGCDVTSSSFTEEDVFDVRRKIGMVFQNPDNQLVATVVEEDVAFGPENLGLPREEIRRRVNSALHLVGMQDYMRHAPHKLSGGQKQRIAIAGIIAMEPECIVLDEPTAMLDPRGRKEVIETIYRLNKEKGITILLITHYMEEAENADRIVVMEKGKIVADGKPKEVFSDIDKIKAVGLDVPQTTELLYMLKQNGFNAPDGVISVEDCERELAKLLSEV